MKLTQATELATARRAIAELDSKVYGGRSPDRAFAHWALKCLLADIEPNDFIINEFTAISGPGDLGIDAWWIDVANSRLILVQAKDTRRVQRKDVQELRAAVEALLGEEYVKRNANAALKEIHSSILDCFYDEAFSIHVVLAAGGQVLRGAYGYCETEGSKPLHISDGNVVQEKEFTLQALSILELADVSRQLSLLEAPHVTLPIAADGDHLAFHYMGGQFRSVLATVPASALALAYNHHRSAIFQHNPRGPQVTKVNDDIVDTLNDDYMRDHFHLLNNGITVVCEGLTVSETQRNVTVNNFQVVNGCQTVYTLFRAQHRLTDKVLANVRIVEGLHNLVARIAKASNSQTAVKAQQLSSLGTEHDRIARELDRYVPPWYYEKQLGQKRMLTATQRRTHTDRYGNRSLNITELGQNGAAFLGFPILAKYSLKAVFEKLRPGDWVYSSIFAAENEGAQLLLPVLVGRKVFESVKEKLSALKQAKADGDEEVFTELDWASYARVHLIGLVGCAVYDNMGAKADAGLPPAADATRLIETLEDWYPAAFEKAYEAVSFFIEVDKSAGTLINLREFFRNPAKYLRMQQRVTR